MEDHFKGGDDLIRAHLTRRPDIYTEDPGCPKSIIGPALVQSTKTLLTTYQTKRTFWDRYLGCGERTLREVALFSMFFELVRRKVALKKSVSG